MLPSTLASALMDVKLTQSFVLDENSVLTDEQKRMLWSRAAERAEQEYDRLMTECLATKPANSLEIVNTGRRDRKGYEVLEFREVDAQGGPTTISYVDESSIRPKYVPRWYDWRAP